MSLLILKEICCISKNMFCGFLLQISTVINTHIKGYFRTKCSVYLQPTKSRRKRERRDGELSLSFDFLSQLCNSAMTHSEKRGGELEI